MVVEIGNGALEVEKTVEVDSVYGNGGEKSDFSLACLARHISPDELRMTSSN